MALAVVLAAGPNVFLLSSSGDAPRSFGRADRSSALPAALVDAVRALPSGERVGGAGAGLRAELAERTRRPIDAVGSADLRAARNRVAWLQGPEERTYLRSLAEHALATALRSPVEVLITLAREEERVERSVERERRAAEAFLGVEDSSLDEYARAWTEHRGRVAAHHRRLESLLEGEARRTLPNLTALVGPRVAARLLAHAGSLEALGRLRGPRLQLLGARRRPSAERGPRFGVIYRADRMDDVPPVRRAAYARSLAALAAIGARADATTHANVAGLLVARRDRRIHDLLRRRA